MCEPAAGGKWRGGGRPVRVGLTADAGAAIAAGVLGDGGGSCCAVVEVARGAAPFCACGVRVTIHHRRRSPPPNSEGQAGHV